MNLPTEKPASARSTIIDVARLSGVAPATVSKALDVTGRYGLSDEVRRRVVEVADRLGYRSRSHGRRPLRSKFRLVGLIHGPSDPTTGQSSQILDTMAETLGNHDHHLLHFSCAGDVNNLRARLPGEHRISGWLGIGQISAEIESVLAELGQPVVLLGGSIDCTLSQVLPDEGGAADLLARHLFNLGHRRIAACVGTAGAPSATRMARIEGYRAAMRRLGLTEHAAILSVPGQIPPAAHTAVITDTFATAVELLDVCAARQMSVPEKLSIASFDDGFAAERMSSTITAVYPRLQQAATEAASLLLDQIEGRQSTAVRKVLVSGSLLVRKSTAPPFGGDKFAKSA